MRNEYRPIDEADPLMRRSNPFARLGLTQQHYLVIAGLFVGAVLMVALSGGSPAERVRDETDMTLRWGNFEKGKEPKEHKDLDTEADAPLYKITGDLKGAHRFFHISDTHVDPFFDPTNTMGPGMCHSCKLSVAAYGDSVYCPTTALPTVDGGEEHLVHDGFAFGRYKCNPPHRLLKSLVTHLKAQDENPEFIVFTGDIAPHGYPGDGYKLTPETKLEDLCQTKFKIFEQQIEYFTHHFPKTDFVFTMGNNDHFPKNKFWPPYIKALGDMFLKHGWLTKEMHETFVKYGSTVHDHDNIRFLAIDLTLFSPGGEVTWVTDKEVEHLSPRERQHKKFPVRAKTTEWVREMLHDAKEKGMTVALVGHQPLNTNKGKDELDVEGLHYGMLKDLMAEYASIIKIGFFGHRNLAGMQEILSPVGSPLIPSITVPGVSPRGMNQPCYNTVYMDKKTGNVLEFEQWVFNLMDENAAALKDDAGTHLGEWRQHHHDVYSWRALSGEPVFDTAALGRVLDKIVHESSSFFALEVWKRAGYIGDETPEQYRCKSMYDTNENQKDCLFPNQDDKCWNAAWIG